MEYQSSAFSFGTVFQAKLILLHRSKTAIFRFSAIGLVGFHRLQQIGTKVKDPLFRVKRIDLKHGEIGFGFGGTRAGIRFQIIGGARLRIANRIHPLDDALLLRWGELMIKIRQRIGVGDRMGRGHDKIANHLRADINDKNAR